MVAYDQAELAQALFSEIGDALFLLDPDTDRLLEVNPVALRLTGCSRAELLDFPATHLFRFETPGGAQRLKGAFTKTMIFHGQDGFLLRGRDEAWVPVSLTVSRLHLAPKTLGLIIARDDRQRRAALAQAQRVEAELRSVLASSPGALWSAERAPGPDVFAGWQFRYVSPLLARIVNRPADYFDHPFEWAEVVHPLYADSYRAALRRLLTGGTESEQLYRVQPVGGGVRWVRDQLRLVRDANGRPTRLDGCLADVTEQWRAEEALRQSEERFRALVEKSRDGILLLDERGVVRYATPAAKFILGYDAEELVGKEVFAFVHPDDVAQARKQMAYSLTHPGEDVFSTLRGLAADGSVRTIESTGVNRLDDPSVRALVVNYRDVTERESSLRELAHQHALLEGLFASIPDVVVYKDREGRFLGGNPAFETLAGRPASHLVGMHCSDIFTDDWAARVRATEETVLATGQTSRGKEWVTYADGRKVLLDIAISPLRGSGGETVGLIIVGRDVTEHEQLEEELRQSHKMEAVGRLAGGIAHDFNNLLTVVLGNLELVRSGAADGKEADEMLAATERAARQAADLTKQMLGFARRQPLRTTAVDLNSLVRDAVGLLRRTIDPRITIRLNPEADLRPAAADPVQVQQVLMNLCLNARDAMPDGGTLVVETANADGPSDEGAAPRPLVRLTVADTGVGMTDEVRTKVFEPFFTTKGVGKGTGLGLAVVYGVAKAHGGWVEVASAPGAGSRFDVYLPCGGGAGAKGSASREAREDVARGNGETVLVADDEVAVRELAKTALELAGYRVLLAVDGADAVEVFRGAKDQVRLVVLDASMPRMSGRQAFEAIRQLSPHVPVLFASGYHGGGLLPDSAPGTRLLNKPYIPSQLAAAVRDMLATK
jgi:PAS domain S-box-containing protein